MVRIFDLLCIPVWSQSYWDFGSLMCPFIDQPTAVSIHDSPCANDVHNALLLSDRPLSEGNIVHM